MNKTQVSANVVDKVLNSNILSLIFIESLLVLFLICILKCICIVEDRRRNRIQRKTSSKIRPNDLI